MAELSRPIERQDPAVPVTDKQMVLLHAYLSGEYEIAQTLHRELTAAGAADGIAELVYAAFVIAARQEFSPTWAHGDVIRFVARVRAQRIGQPDPLDPLAAERQLRSALGETMTGDRASAEAQAGAQIILLEALTQSQNLDESERASLLNQAREVANAMLARRA